MPDLMEEPDGYPAKSTSTQSIWIVHYAFMGHGKLGCNVSSSCDSLVSRRDTASVSILTANLLGRSVMSEACGVEQVRKVRANVPGPISICCRIEPGQVPKRCEEIE